MNTTWEYLAASPLALIVTWDDEMIASLALEWAGDGAIPQPKTETGRALQAALERYVAGEPTDWPELPFRFEGLPPFKRKVLESLFREVGHGRYVTYGELAAMAGSPKAARAVGQAMATNPWPLVVPCHRVSGHGGRLTGFGPGLEMKRYLLELEGALKAAQR